jgi:hypothetical protein
MTDSIPTLSRGDEYVVFFVGGPYDGTDDRRISTDGSWDETLTVLAAEAGNETLINYDVASWREVGGVYHVTYNYDPKDSEQVEDPAVRD